MIFIKFRNSLCAASKLLCVGQLINVVALFSCPLQAEENQIRVFGQPLNAPQWLETKGEFRARYESLDGEFRAGTNGSDQLLAVRTLVNIKANFEPLTVGIELQDARTYLDDEDTPLSTSFVNTFEFINFNADLHLASVFGESTRSDLKLGRQTVDVGSERFIERNGYRNTINSYDGAHLRTSLKNKNRFETFVVAPVRALPRGFEDLSENRRSFDKTDDALHFWGTVYTDEKNWINDAKTEIFAYGLHEQDTADRATADREIYTFGFRILRAPAVQILDYELEYAYQFGARYESTASEDVSRLDVKAQTLHAEIGYTFDIGWWARFAFEFDYASGDQNPNDDRFDSYDRLFGARRGDLGFTSIHGPLVRNNLILPGIDFEFRSGEHTDGFISYQRAYLDSASDEFDVANLRDVSGESGTFIGDTLDMQIRHWIIPGQIRWDIGASALFFGDYLNQVPGGPTDNRTLYGFTQITTKF